MGEVGSANKMEDRLHCNLGITATAGIGEESSFYLSRAGKQGLHWVDSGEDKKRCGRQIEKRTRKVQER